MVAIAVDLCGKLADPCGAELLVDAGERTLTVAELRALIADGWPALADLMGSPRVRACIDEAMVGDQAPVRVGARVAFFPPVSGG